jgi:hypothetical protein
LAVSTYLVVAHRTLVEDHLIDHVRDLAAREGCRFHLVVPVTHPPGAWSDGAVTGAAEKRVAEGIAAFAAVGALATGEVGDANPVYAAATALRTSDVDDWAGIIVSTLPPGVSRWLGLDAVSRISREFDLPVTHLVATRTPADA